MKKILKGIDNFSVAAALVAGVALTVASAGIQVLVFDSFLEGEWFAVVVVAALEATKASSVVLCVTQHHRLKGRGWIVSALRSTLFSISLLSTLVLISASVTNPNLEKVTDEQIAAVNEDIDARIEDVKARYAPRVGRVDSLMIEERNDTYSDGTFMGPQYRELEGKRADLDSAQSAEIDKLEQQRQQRIAAIRNSPPDDRRVQNAMVADFREVMKGVFGTDIPHAGVAFVAAGLISLAIELAIYATFFLIAVKIEEQVFDGTPNPSLNGDHRDRQAAFEQSLDAYVDSIINEIDDIDLGESRGRTAGS